MSGLFVESVLDAYHEKNIARLESLLNAHPQSSSNEWFELWPKVWERKDWEEGRLAVLAHLSRHYATTPLFSYVQASIHSALMTVGQPMPVKEAKTMLDHLDFAEHNNSQRIVNDLLNASASNPDSVEYFTQVLFHPNIVKHNISTLSTQVLVFVETMHARQWQGAEELRQMWREKLTPSEMAENVCHLLDLFCELSALISRETQIEKIHTHIQAWLGLAEHKDEKWWQEVSAHPTVQKKESMLGSLAPAWVAYMEKQLLHSAVHLPSTSKIVSPRRI